MFPAYLVYWEQLNDAALLSSGAHDTQPTVLCHLISTSVLCSETQNKEKASDVIIRCISLMIEMILLTLSERHNQSSNVPLRAKERRSCLIHLQLS